jgi:hypothetical protein
MTWKQKLSENYCHACGDIATFLIDEGWVCDYHEDELGTHFSESRPVVDETP